MNDYYWREEVYEYIENLKHITMAVGLNLYWIDQKHHIITQMQTGICTYEKCMPPTANEKCLACLAAERKQMIIVKDVASARASNPEVKIIFNASSILCVPIMDFNHEVMVVFELYRTEGNPFSQKAISYILQFAKWFAIWLSLRFEYNKEATERNFLNKLELLILEYVNQTLSYENFLTRVMKLYKECINADKYFFYDYNMNTGFSDFYEIIGDKVVKTATRLKFYKIDSFCYKVRVGKKPLVVRIEDGRNQLDKEIKQDPDNPIRYMLYYPLLFGEKFLGILALGNFEREDCDFSDEDQFHVSTLVTLLADVLIYKYIMEKEEIMSAHREILRETFINLLHARLNRQFSISGSVAAPHELHRMSWELVNPDDPNQMTYLCKMFQNIYHFDWDRLKSFLLCAQIAHNKFPYHNIKTTFHICRTVYCIIERLGPKLKPHEKASLMIAAVTCYCGHNGLDNRVMLKTGHPLTKIYKTYMKENHRIWMLNLLLEQTMFLRGDNESEQITSTAHTLLLKSKKYESRDFRKKIVHMLDTETFNLENKTCRLYALMAIMRIGMHGRHMQPFTVSKTLREKYYEETASLGDIEKEHGLSLSERKNRERSFNISNIEIDYIKNSVLSTLEILARIFPETSPWMAMPKDVLTAHEILVGCGNKRVWDPEMCVGV